MADAAKASDKAIKDGEKEASDLIEPAASPPCPNRRLVDDFGAPRDAVDGVLDARFCYPGRGPKPGPTDDRSPPSRERTPPELLRGLQQEPAASQGDDDRSPPSRDRTPPEVLRALAAGAYDRPPGAQRPPPNPSYVYGHHPTLRPALLHGAPHLPPPPGPYAAYAHPPRPPDLAYPPDYVYPLDHPDGHPDYRYPPAPVPRAGDPSPPWGGGAPLA